MTQPQRRLRGGGWLVLLLLVGVPLAEIWTILQVGKVVGPWWTIALLLVMGAAGSWLIQREGRRAWAALRTPLGSGRMPATELADGALILIGGTLMLAPGFLTDLVGVLLILPITRPVARRLLGRFIEQRVVVLPDAHRPEPPADGPVVRGDVVD